MSADVSLGTTFALQGDREIILQHVFDAPRELVWQVSNDPALIQNWWGPKYLNTTVEKMEIRPGGAWRIIQRDPAGNEYAFNGVYREVVAPERIVRTFEFEGMPGHIIVETATLEEIDGRTRLTVTSVFETPEDRDGMMQSGAESGARESYERLTELVAQIRKEHGNV